MPRSRYVYSRDLFRADRIGLTLGAEMIIVILIVMVGYWIVQRRARRWLR